MPCRKSSVGMEVAENEKCAKGPVPSAKGSAPFAERRVLFMTFYFYVDNSVRYTV